MYKSCPILAFAAFILPYCAAACDSGTVRDAAFHSKRDAHRLCVFAHDGDAAAEAMSARLEQWFQKQPPGFNVTPERVNADDPTVAWPDYGIPSIPPALPVTALIGRFNALRRTFVIDHWESALTEEDLAVLRTSPAREALKRALVDYWAVLLYAPARQSPRALQPIFDAVTAKWAQEQSPGVTVARFDRNDPKERVLCAFAGLEPDGPDWVGVVFGRGKLMAPPLSGEDITEPGLNKLVGALAVPCTCLQEFTTPGLDIPMVWEPELDRKFASILANPLGYTEITFEKQAEALAEEVPDASRRMIMMALAAVTVFGAAALIVTGWLIWRARRNARIAGES